MSKFKVRFIAGKMEDDFIDDLINNVEPNVLFSNNAQTKGWFNYKGHFDIHSAALLQRTMTEQNNALTLSAKGATKRMLSNHKGAFGELTNNAQPNAFTPNQMKEVCNFVSSSAPTATLHTNNSMDVQQISKTESELEEFLKSISLIDMHSTLGICVRSR